MMLGAKALPEKWIGPLHDTLDTGISGYNQVQISHLAEETLKLSKTIPGSVNHDPGIDYPVEKEL